MTDEKERNTDSPENSPEGGSNFIKDIVRADLAAGKNQGRVATRFPPEPNGYLHIGHAKSIVLNFGLAREFGGTCNLRFDDTDPGKESVEYVDAIAEDVRWLGYDWEDRLYYASDYFEQLYNWAIELIEKGLAYVDDLNEEEIREHRGNYYKKAVESPYRNRSVEENLDLFKKMRAGEFPDGSKVLRVKGDLSSQNMNMRDPLMYRIRRVTHHRTGDDWCIYPMYDYAHGQSDAIEKITHSICTLEFADHRPLYDWFVEKLELDPAPHQYEFARLNLSYTMMSKRRLLQLVEEGKVEGWDDPRMPTIAGLRRRGFTPESLRDFCERIGVGKADSLVDIGLLEHCLREDLNVRAPRVMAVLDPLKVVIENYPEGETEQIEALYFPDQPEKGTRMVPFGREIFVERDDFREEPPGKWRRLAPGREVRLRYACYITCREIIKDENGEVIELRCEWDPESRGGSTPDGRKVRGTIHWVPAAESIKTEVRLYDRLFTEPDLSNLDEGADWRDYINPESLKRLTECRLEPALADIEAGSFCQFERLGYFYADPIDSTEGRPVFNRTVALRDSWARLEKKSGGK